MESVVTLAVVGCGQRGKNYSRYAISHPGQCKVVAIAEPRPATRKQFAEQHHVDQSLVFETWEQLLAASQDTLDATGRRLADAVLVTVQDDMHLDVTKAFAKQSYHILCEKPMATTAEGCVEMAVAVEKAGIIFGMGHVMRYSPYIQEISRIIASGHLGELVNVAHIEPVGFYHVAHSYVRGSWGKERDSSFALVTKCCHDIDLLCHSFGPSKPTRVSSFGSLKHFNKRSKPVQAQQADRCLDCSMERECEYSAKKIYLDPLSQSHTGWPIKPLVDGLPDIENVTEALLHGPYGRCVYECDNDVCDHQVVNFEFSNGSTASLTMVAFSSTICERQTRLHFTHGEIVGNMTTYTVSDFRKNTTQTFEPERLGGHGGGDAGLIKTFVDAVRAGEQNILGADVEDVMHSHLMVFAAEMSRREGKVVHCQAFENEVKGKVLVETEATAHLRDLRY